MYTLPDANRKTIHQYQGAWLSWVNDVDVVASPTTDDQWSRIYYTNANADTSLAIHPPDDLLPKERVLVGGVQQEWRLGVPKPATTPTVAQVDYPLADLPYQINWVYEYHSAPSMPSIPGLMCVSQSDDLAVAGYIGPSTYTPLLAGKLPHSTFFFTTPPRTEAGPDDVLWIYGYVTSVDGNSIGTLTWNNMDEDTKGLSSAKVEGVQASVVSTGRALPYAYGDMGLDLIFAQPLNQYYTKDLSYVYTYVSSFGEEGMPSEPSDVFTVAPDRYATVSNIATTVPAGWNVATIRIYRTVTTASGTAFQFVDEIAVNVFPTTYVDKVNDADVGDPISSTDWAVPPEDLQGICLMPGGFLLGFTGKQLYASEVYMPHAWPVKYSQPVPVRTDVKIIGIGVTQNCAIVMTESDTFIVTGDTPETLSVAKLDIQQSCSSKRSVCAVGSVLFYAGPDGYVGVKGTTGELFTAPYFGTDEWQAISPAQFIGIGYAQQLFWWNDNGSFIFDYVNGWITTIDEKAQGAYVDTVADALYMIQGDQIVEYEGGDTYKTATWRSKVYHSYQPWYPNMLRLVCDAYPQSVNLYGDGVLQSTLQMTDNKARRVPVTRKSKNWEVEVLTDSVMSELSVGSSAQVIM